MKSKLLLVILSCIFASATVAYADVTLTLDPGVKWSGFMERFSNSVQRWRVRLRQYVGSSRSNCCIQRVR